MINIKCANIYDNTYGQYLAHTCIITYTKHVKQIIMIRNLNARLNHVQYFMHTGI